MKFFFFFTLALSYNQPKFCPYATWNPNAITFSNRSLVGQWPYGIFVDSSNNVYVANRDSDRIQIWINGSIYLTTTIFVGPSDPLSIFVTMNGDIYVDNGYINGRVDKFTLNSNTGDPVIYVETACFGLFVDMNDTLYCSIRDLNQVVKRWLSDNVNTTSTAAGNGTSGSASNMLSYPHGIFVDINFDLYVADCGNGRIQLFGSGQLNGITVAGEGSSPSTITLVAPTSIVLDADKHLFIVDSGKNRIVGSGPHGFRCLVGCSESTGSASNQLNGPHILSLDSYGNMYVTDMENHRIQKFLLSTNSCDKYK